jgi:hypothetical protein
LEVLVGLFRSRKKRAEERARKDNDAAALVLFEYMAKHLDAGGRFEDFMSAILLSEVEWEATVEGWYIDIENEDPPIGSEVSIGDVVSLVQGRGGMTENAVVVSLDGSRIYISFNLEEFGMEGSMPWFRDLL